MSNGTIERRYIPAEFETRAKGDEGIVEGYAAVWDKLSKDLGGFVEQFRRGTFAKHLADGGEVHALFNHDPAEVLGRRGNGTNVVSEDDTGVHYRVVINLRKPSGRDRFEDIDRGDVHQSSVGFRVVTGGDDWGFTDQGYPLRTVTAAALRDVSPVTFPAYSDTEVDVALRSLSDATGIELSAIAEAAESRDLADLIAGRHSDDGALDNGDDGGNGPGSGAGGDSGQRDTHRLAIARRRMDLDQLRQRESHRGT